MAPVLVVRSHSPNAAGAWSSGVSDVRPEDRPSSFEPETHTSHCGQNARLPTWMTLPLGVPDGRLSTMDSSLHTEKARGHLLVVLSNPATTSGARTLQRVELARTILGYKSASTVNLFSFATHRTGEISMAGAEADGWTGARKPIADSLHECEAVLLAYGCAEPTGPARQHFRNQVTWLRTEIGTRAIPVWTIDGRPRHPSRWQRHTHATHPDVPFREALERVFKRVQHD